MADANTNTPKLPSRAGQEIGQSGTSIFRGYISSEEYVVDLQGVYALNQYDIMRRSDSTIHGVLQVVKNPIISANWDIEPASDDEADVEIADFVKRELFSRKIKFQDVMREGLTSLDFGHSVAEKVYEMTMFDGKPRIGISRIASRKQRTIRKWELENGKPGVIQSLPNGVTAEIPREKLIYIINEREGENYHGISLLRFAYKPWKIKDSLELMNAIALEKLSIPVPVLRKGIGGTTVNEADLQIARNLLRQWRANQSAYIELPPGLDLEFPTLNGASVKDTLPTIEHQNEQIWSSVLASFMSLGQGGNGGSRALSGDLTTMFYKSLEAVARTLQQAYQEDLVQDLVDLNFSELPNGYPKLVFSSISDDDFKSIAESTSALMNAGALHADTGIENRLRTMLKLPEMTEEMLDSYDDMVRPPKPVVDPTANKPDEAPAKSTETVEDGKDDKTLEKDEKTNADSLIQSARELEARIYASIFEDN